MSPIDALEWKLHAMEMSGKTDTTEYAEGCKKLEQYYEIGEAYEVLTELEAAR